MFQYYTPDKVTWKGRFPSGKLSFLDISTIIPNKWEKKARTYYNTSDTTGHEVKRIRSKYTREFDLIP